MHAASWRPLPSSWCAERSRRPHNRTVKRYGLYIFDLDGTLYRGEEVISGTPEVVAQLRAEGALIRYVTNNSGRTRQNFVQKLSQMGFAARPEEIVSSATGVASLAKQRGYRSAFVVGEPGLVTTLREVGVAVVNALPNGLTVPQGAVQIPVDAVIVGICRHFDYSLMESAMNAILGGAEFVATNRDATYPLEGDRFQPGAGAVVAGIATCTGREPFVVGKPNPFLIETILQETGVSASETLVVGDRLDTDIECGVRAGCDTFLVLTGVEKKMPNGQLGAETLSELAL